MLQGDGLFAVVLQQAKEAALGQQLHVFCKHAKQAARQESRHMVGPVARLLQRPGEFGQLPGHLTRDAGTGAAGVQAVGVGPDGLEALSHIGVDQAAQGDAVAARVRKGRVGGAAAGEL